MRFCVILSFAVVSIPAIRSIKCFYDYSMVYRYGDRVPERVDDCTNQGSEYCLTLRKYGQEDERSCDRTGEHACTREGCYPYHSMYRSYERCCCKGDLCNRVPWSNYHATMPTIVTSTTAPPNAVDKCYYEYGNDEYTMISQREEDCTNERSEYCVILKKNGQYWKRCDRKGEQACKKEGCYPDSADSSYVRCCCKGNLCNRDMQMTTPAATRSTTTTPTPTTTISVAATTTRLRYASTATTVSQDTTTARTGDQDTVTERTGSQETSSTERTGSQDTVTERTGSQDNQTKSTGSQNTSTEDAGSQSDTSKDAEKPNLANGLTTFTSVAVIAAMYALA